jgi:hypothetical protein
LKQHRSALLMIYALDYAQGDEEVFATFPPSL